MKSLIAFVVGLFLLAGQAAAQNADFVLANATGYPIRELYVNSSKSEEWGDDILGKHVINNQEEWKISFTKKGNVCRQDMKIVFDDDGSEVVWEGLNLCEINKITLTYDRRSGKTTARTE